MRLQEHTYRTISSIHGPLLLVEKIMEVRMGELIHITFADGARVAGEVLKIDGSTVLVQIFGDSRGLDTQKATVTFTDAIQRAPLSLDLIDRTYSGCFKPLDGSPMIVPDCWRPISGHPINPVARARPEEFIETGFSTIDGLNTLVKGQKLPIFSSAGLPAREMTTAILRQARTRTETSPGKRGGFTLVFVALGLTFHEYAFYKKALDEMDTPFVAFINQASDPVVERIQAPRFALTVAEFLAFDHGRDVLVVITDMTNYCDALREVSTAREELPGRRGYPGYMYSDLASLYERAGRLKDRPGSITMLPVVTMPEDDITHPIPDLTGYITEGQIVLTRELHQQGIFPPVDVLPCLSRLMQHGIGEGRTRSDHSPLANRLYRHYAKGRELRALEAIVGRDGMSEEDRKMLDFATAFERDLVHQGSARRSIEQTLDAGAELLVRFSLENS